MICPNCEFEIDDGTELCPYCKVFLKQTGEKQDGQRQPIEQPYTASASSAMESDVYYTRKEFLESPEMKPLKKSLRSGMRLLYVIIALNMIVNLLLIKSFILVIYVLFLLGMALAIQFTQSRVCSIVLFAVFAANTILGKILNGRWSGLLGVFNMMFLTMTLFQINAKWKEYQDMQAAKNKQFL